LNVSVSKPEPGSLSIHQSVHAPWVRRKPQLVCLPDPVAHDACAAWCSLTLHAHPNAEDGDACAIPSPRVTLDRYLGVVGAACLVNPPNLPSPRDPRHGCALKGSLSHHGAARSHFSRSRRVVAPH
jgi:hypothetical protein